MYYVQCEKQTNGLFGSWGSRLVAFDTMRRHLFYTSTIRKGEPPRWKAKVKVDKIVQDAREHVLYLGDLVNEKDLFVVDVCGESRTLSPNEVPAAGPLLCESTGLEPIEGRFSYENEMYLKDPFFLVELYEALRNQFIELREMQGITAETANSEENRKKPLTLNSPRTKHEKSTRVHHLFRFNTEYDFRRFYFVVQTVLGYDKLNPRPYRGLPPYDPRNGVFFAHIPLYAWHTFKALNKTCFYTFLRGSITGRDNSTRDLTVAMRGVFLCITFDMVLILQDTGSIPIWVRLLDVKEFRYNAYCNSPFLAFVTDPGVPDIVFIPQAPVVGGYASKSFDPTLEVLRVQKVLHDVCFSSLSVRRVIKIKPTVQPSVKGFVDRYEKKHNTDLIFHIPNYAGAMAGPLPQEHLAAIWEDAERIYEQQDHSIAQQSAIPLYANSQNNALPLSRVELQAIARRLYQERRYNNTISGIGAEEAQSIVEQIRTTGSQPTPRLSLDPSVPSSSTHHSFTNNNSRLLSPHSRVSTRPRHSPPAVEGGSPTSRPAGEGEEEEGEEEAPLPAVHNNSFNFNVSFASDGVLGNHSFASFVIPGSRYITKEEAALMETGPVEVDEHQAVQSASSAQEPLPEFLQTETPICNVQPTEWDVASLVNHSFSHAPIPLESTTLSPTSTGSGKHFWYRSPTSTAPPTKRDNVIVTVHRETTVAGENAHSHDENKESRPEDELEKTNPYTDPNELET